MKKLSFFLMAMILSFAASIQAAEVTETIAMKKFGGLSTSSYENVTKTGTSDLGTEMVAYAFNPNTGQIRGNKTTIAGASITTKDDSKNWSLYNTQAMPGAIKKITVTQTETGSNKFQNSMYVALGTTNQGAVTTVTGAQKNTTGTAAEFTFDIDETQGYTYFKLLSNVKFTSGSVKGVVVTVTYVTAEGGEEEVTKYTVTANVNDPAMGAVSGAGEYAEGKTATLTANANPGYKFVNWSNGSTDNPLKITVTEDIEITANFEAIPPMTCAEAAAAPKDAVVVLNPFDVVAVVKGAGYIYIKDESGVNLIYDFNLDDQLKAGDHVEGFVGVSSPYNGLPELKPSVAFADLTVTPGTAPEPTLFTEVPVKADVNKYVKFKNVTLTDNATFTTSSATNATMVVNGTNVTLRNTFKLAATLSKDKAYNLVGFVAVYNSTIQVYFLSVEEYIPTYTITVSANAEGEDVVTGAGEYEEGEEVTVTASEDLEGWVFIGWTEDGEFVAKDPEYTFVVKSDVELVAVYAMDLGENEVTDLVIDGDNMLLTGSVAGFPMGTMNLELALGEYDDEEGVFLLTEESKLYVGETNFTFVDGMAAIDMNTNSAMAIVVFEHNGTYYYMTIDMSAAPAEPIVVVVENATLDDQVESTGFFYMAGECTIDGVTYPVKAEIPDFDKTKAEAEYENVMVEVGTWEGEYLGNATGIATVSVVDNVVTLTGVIENPMTHVAFDVTISGTLPVVEPAYDPIELYVTDLEIKTEEQVILKGTAMMQSPKDITISLVVDASEENEDGTFNLTDESEITFMGTPMTFISGVAMIDLESNMARAIVRVEFEEMYFEFTFNMTAPIPATVVVVENAIISNNDGFFFMNGTWNDEENTTYPVQVEIQGFDKTKAEAEYMATVTVGDIVNENGPWLGSAEGEIVATIVDGVVTITGVLENPYTQVVLDVTISGTLPSGATALENLDTTVAPVKAIVNGQLVIVKDGVQYNAQGAVVK